MQDIGDRYKDIKRIVEGLYLGSREKVHRKGLIYSKICLIRSQEIILFYMYLLIIHTDIYTYTNRPSHVHTHAYKLIYTI